MVKIEKRSEDATTHGLDSTIDRKHADMLASLWSGGYTEQQIQTYPQNRFRGPSVVLAVWLDSWAAGRRPWLSGWCQLAGVKAPRVLHLLVPLFRQ